jgi:Domain of unknown function DUF29
VAEEKPSTKTGLVELQVLRTLQERLERYVVHRSASQQLRNLINRLMFRWVEDQATDFESIIDAKELPELIYLVRAAFRAWASREALDLLRRLEQLAQEKHIDLPEMAPPHYDDDFAAWAKYQASTVRSGMWEDVDQEHLAEELEGLSRSEHHELENRLEVLTTHLLKWQYRQKHPNAERGWRLTIVEQRRRLTRLLQRSPSLTPLCPTAFDETYPHARLVASIELDLPDDTTLLHTCPWTVEQALAADFWPDAIA